MADRKIKAYMVAAGQFHDIDYARLELLKLLAEHENIRTQVATDYHDLDAIRDSDFLISYTCNLVPTTAQQQALMDYITAGGRWFALHGTNSILEFTDKGVAAPETAPTLMETLGTQFIAHPPIQPFTVKTDDEGHELVKGIGEFDTDDELYLSRIHGNLHQLMYSEFNGRADGFVESDWLTDDRRPVYYINTLGRGEVLYLNLGHCRGHYDMAPMTDYYPDIEQGSWAKPQYYELLRRAIRYCAGV